MSVDVSEIIEREEKKAGEQTINDALYVLKNIGRGNQRFLHVHDYETGDPIIISPACCASVEFKTESEE